MAQRKSEEQILLVDDLALVRRTVPARLGALGCKVHGVVTVPEAREWLDKHSPSLILLDVVLPGTDGLTFCRELKADPRHRDIPVMIFTDVAGNILDRSLEAGADDYVPKRLNDAFFRIRVHLHLHLAELRRAHAGSPVEPGVSEVVLATQSTLLQAQLPSQLAAEGHHVRLADRLEDVLSGLTGAEKLLILDFAIDPEGIHDFLSQLRMESGTASLPVLLLCEKDEIERLVGLEFMLDDVLVKPLTAVTNRQRLRLLLELGHLVRS